MVLPNFIVVGAPRCATTTLHYYFDRHPEVRISDIKEPSFFLFGPDGALSIAEPSIIRKSVSDRAAYERLFGSPTPEQTAVGEASPLYLSVPAAAERIRETCGPVKIIALVRDPVERAWSHFVYAFPEQAAEGGISRFQELCDAEMARDGDDDLYRTSTHLLRLGRYGEQVRRYQALFGPDQVKVLVLEELERDPGAAGNELCDFLGVGREPLTVADRVNISGTRAGGVAGGARRLAARFQPVLKTALPPKVVRRLARLRARIDDRSLQPLSLDDAALRARLVEWFRDDIDDLAVATGADLDHWLR